jgi:excisionase family DNA binding protein
MMPAKKQKLEKLLRVSTVAKRLNVSKQSVYNHIIAGNLSAVRTGPSCGIRIFQSSLNDFIEKRSRPE